MWYLNVAEIEKRVNGAVYNQLYKLTTSIPSTLS